MVSMKIMRALILGLHLYLAIVAFAQQDNAEPTKYSSSLRGVSEADHSVRHIRSLADATNLPTNEDSVLRYRNTYAEVLAMTVPSIFPGCKPVQGSHNENGFYYNFHCPSFNTSITPDEMEYLWREMWIMATHNWAVVQNSMSWGQLEKYIISQGEDVDFKQKLLNNIRTNNVFLVRIGKDGWYDFYGGPKREFVGYLDELILKPMFLGDVNMIWREQGIDVVRFSGTVRDLKSNS